MIGVKNHWVILENDDQNVIRKEIFLMVSSMFQLSNIF